MKEYAILPLRSHPQWAERAAQWFYQKWGVPLEEYQTSIRACTLGRTIIPQWYLAVKEQEIIAGAGVIQNDFHERRDLSPNLCALFVEEAYRGRGIARELLDSIRRDLGRMEVETLYLITGHTEFYEKCGWEFLTMVHEDDGNLIRMYCVSTLQ